MNPVAMLTELLQAIPARYRRPLYLACLAACLAAFLLPHVGVTVVLGLAVSRIASAALVVSGILHGLAAGNTSRGPSTDPEGYPLAETWVDSAPKHRAPGGDW